MKRQYYAWILLAVLSELPGLAAEKLNINYHDDGPHITTCRSGNPHFEDDRFLHGYQQGERRRIKPLGGQAYKDTLFVVTIDIDDNGRLSFEKSDNGPIPPAALRPTYKPIPKWSECVTICKNGLYTSMKLADAKEIFGKPIYRGTFYSFDALAPAESLYEAELFLVDFKFDRDEEVAAYRIRGIGIVHPEWITKY